MMSKRVFVLLALRSFSEVVWITYIGFWLCLNYNKNMKRQIIIVAVIALVAFVVYFFYFRPPFKYSGPQFPKYFPKEMITDSYVVDLEVLNDAGKLANEKQRASISYKSQRSMDENLKSFKEYFTANGFIVENLPESNVAKFLGARKDKTSVSIALWKGSPVRISILYIISK